MSLNGTVKVVFLGTNGWFTSPTGNTTCVLLETENSYVILDAGNGIKDIGAFITDREKEAFLFLSHFHLDHICGLHILNRFDFPKGLTVCCYQGGKEILDRFVSQPFTISFQDLPYPVAFRELAEGKSAGFPFGLECRELVHSSKCFGYRFETKEKVISYCTDTGSCPNAVALAKDADLLITECAWKQSQENAQWPHLSPEDAAQLAKEANARRLALIHFDADNYRTLDERRDAEARSKTLFPNVCAAEDQMVIEI